jgi:hypothetical protein
MPLGNTAGRANAHTPSVDVMVIASREPSLFLKSPTVVQLPGVAHDTEVNLARGEAF